MKDFNLTSVNEFDNTVLKTFKDTTLEKVMAESEALVELWENNDSLIEGNDIVIEDKEGNQFVLTTKWEKV